MSLKSRILLLNSWEAPTYAKCLLFSCLLALLSLELLIRSRLTASFKEQQMEAADQHFFLHFISFTVWEQLWLNPGYHSPQAHTNQYEVSDTFVDEERRENCSNVTCSLCNLEILASLQGVSKRGTQLQRCSDFKSGPPFWTPCSLGLAVPSSNCWLLGLSFLGAEQLILVALIVLRN